MSGFVYIWYDKGRNRFYIGSHWGNENDGYICSSDAMREAYKRRPQDFKRRIISRITTTRRDLLMEEQRWLYMIPIKQLGRRYYNFHTCTHHWHTDPESKKSISERMKGNKHGAIPCSPEKAKKISEAKRKKFQEKREAGLSCYSKPHGGWSKGRKQPIEEIEKRRQSNLNWWTTEAGMKRKELLRQNFINNNPKHV